MSIARLVLLTAALGVPVNVSASRAADHVAVTEEQIKTLEIAVAPVKPAKSETVAILPATVVRPLNTRRTMTAPFSGTVTEIAVLPGQRVEKGLTLATISSRELLENQGQLAQAEADLQAAQAIAQRRRSLAEKGFQSPLLADEAEAQVGKIRAVIEQRRRSANIDGIAVGPSGNYSIAAQSDGIVVDTRVMPGDGVEANAAVVTLDTSDEIWIEVQVPSATLANIRVGDAIRVSEEVTGKVVAVGTSVDPVTRSAKLYAALTNAGALRPGEMLNVELERAAVSGALSVPANSVTRIDSKVFVFVKSESGFSLKPVELRGKSAERATVVGEIAPNDLVAASGLPQLEQLLARE